MAKFIACNYHDTTKVKDNPPINIDLVQFFDKDETHNAIYFYFAGDDKMHWLLENKETMQLEYNRILNLLTQY